MNLGSVVTMALLLALSAGLLSAAELPRDKRFTNTLGIRFVRIEPGQFQMGTGDAPPRTREHWQQRDWDESPTHRVKITRPFYVGVFEVTNAQFEKFAPEHAKLRGVGGVSRGDDEPVTMVTWQQAVDFCRWLSKKEGLPYRLPTEAEWEYACRAGTTTEFSTGEKLTAQQANVGRGADGQKKIATVPVGQYPPNPWGLHDLHGNVAEWCHDWYGTYPADPQTDPVGRAAGYARVVRGGSYNIPSWQDDSSRWCRSANRGGHLPEDANRCTGFRMVLGEMPSARPLPADDPPQNARDVKQPTAKAATTKETAGESPKPHFENFAGRRSTIDENTWGPIFSHWNHFTACCVCPNGDVLACWYTTVSESGPELAQAASRLPAGSDSWQKASLFFDVADVNDHAPVLLCDGQRVYHFASQSLRGWDDTSVVLRTSDDSGATWSAPRIIVRREGPHQLSQSCSAVVADNGMIYLAIDGDAHRRIGLLASSDRGRTWKLADRLPHEVFDKRAIHPALAQAKDGSLMAFLRGPDPLPRVVRGKEEWTAEKMPFGGINVGQKATALRLASGALLLCAADAAKPPVTGQRGTLAALSDDGGRSWSHVRHVEGVGGYLSSAQAADGTIYLVGSKLASVAFNEAWLREGKAIASGGP